MERDHKLKLTIEIDSRNIGKSIEKAIAKKSTILEKFGEKAIARTRADIISQKSPDGQAFAPLKKATIENKQRLGYILAILRATDAMLNAFESEVSGDIVSITQPKFYGAILQKGRDNMPARPFLGWTQKDAEVLIALLLAELS